MSNPLFVLPIQSQTGHTYLATQYVLRVCNRDYRRETGTYATSAQPPELDANKQPGKIAPFRTFETTYGHISDGKTRVFTIQHHGSVVQWLDHISSSMRKSIVHSNAWDLNGILHLPINELHANPLPSLQQVLRSQADTLYSPLCAHTAQAWVESVDKRGKNDTIYGLPSQSTTVTGVYGGLHNNAGIEMGFDEPEGMRDMERRKYNKLYLGFLCAGHTAHSHDAGKSRRLASYTRVRVASSHPLWPLEDSIGLVPCTGAWVVYCMGSTFNTSLDGICMLVQSMEAGLRRYYQSQFDYPNTYELSAPPTYMVYYRHKVLYISISPGVVLRSTPDKSMVDSAMLHTQERNPIVQIRKLPAYGPNSIQYNYSAYFMLCPYAEHDRPPRGLFASGQTIQAVCLPWSPATARVSPLHSSTSLVGTEFSRRIESDVSSNDEAIWDVLPGEDMMICFMNIPLNYDDSMVVSSKFADMGGFSTSSLCTYRISQKDTQPEVGEVLCNKKHKWWKMPCSSSCKCRVRSLADWISSPRVPTGKVIETIRTEDGGISIKVLSFAQILTGDKISTMHGQKGVVRIVPYEDLPVITMPDNTTFVADLYMAVGSVVSRQTNGQIYESGAGWGAAKTGTPGYIATPQDVHMEECSRIISGIDGSHIVCQSTDGTIENVKATVGITRVLNQTQLTRERHHLTHNIEGKHSLGTAPGRASGGGVAVGEMEFHAMFSSGLYGCAQELIDRGNMCRVPVCRNCKRVLSLHDCGLDPDIVYVRMSSDIVASDEISACINQSSNVYDIAHI